MKAATILLILVSSFFSFYQSANGCALHSEPTTSNGENDEPSTDGQSLNDTVTDALVLTPLANSSENIETSANRTNIAFDQNVLNDQVVNCDPDQNVTVCKDELLETCRSVDGVNQCTCPENVNRSEDGKCMLFNECNDEQYNNCSSFALCVDLPDGYTCRCKAGFRDDSKSQDALEGRVCIPLGSGTNDSDKIGIFIPQSDAVIGNIAQATSNFSTEPTTYQPQELFNDSVPFNEKNANEIFADIPFSNDLLELNKSTDPTGLRNGSTVSVSLLTKLRPITSVPFTVVTTGRSLIGNQTIVSKSGKREKVEPVSPLTSGKLKDIFKAFDADGNELITFGELKKSVANYRINLNDPDLSAMIKVADVSGDGLVDFVEFSSLMRKSS